MFHPYLGNFYLEYFFSALDFNRIKLLLNKIKAAFKKNLPQSPIKLLHLIKPSVRFRNEVKIVKMENEVDEFCEFTLHVDNLTFVGKGENRALAKKGAYKRAVRALQNPGSSSYIFF